MTPSHPFYYLKTLLIFLFYLVCASSKGQCLDTNTILDSIYVLSMEDLNKDEKLIDRKSRELPSPGDKYQLIILDKILSGLPNEIHLKGADSSFFNFSKKQPFDVFIMKVSTETATKYHLSVIHALFTNYLITLDSTLHLIDFISLSENLPTMYSTKEKSNMDRKIKSKYANLVFTQTHFTETTYQNTNKKTQLIHSIKKFTIDKLGYFKPL